MFIDYQLIFIRFFYFWSSQIQINNLFTLSHVLLSITAAHLEE